MCQATKVVLLTIATMAVTGAIIFGVVFLRENWNWIALGHHKDTLRLRCEEEQGGVLIGKVCFRKDAVLWRGK